MQVEVKLSKVESYFEKDILVQQNVNTTTTGNHSSSSASNTEERDQFHALEVKSNEFIFGPFNWCLSLKPQPLLLPVAESSSWATPIRKALQQHRLSSGEIVDLDQLGLSASIQRNPVRASQIPFTSNNNVGRSTDNRFPQVLNAG